MHELLDDAGQRPLLVFVDDAHLLDDGSASLVHQLSQSGAATVLACVLSSGRAGQPGTDPMVVLWKDYGAARIELNSLDGEAIEDLLLAVLGGPVDTVSLRQIAEHSLGDPLFLHELVVGALASGSLREESGIWRLRGALLPTARLVDMVTTRLGTLTDAERHALELTALGEPLAQPALDQLADAAAIEALEDRGFMDSRMDGRRLQVCLAHPVFGDVVRAGINPRRQRVLARELAEASGGRRQDDTLLLASLRLVGGEGSSELLIAGAKAARERRDYELTERMARAAVDSGEGFEARLLAAEAAHRSGRHEQAARELATLAEESLETSERVRVALVAFDLEYFMHGAADMTAVDVLLGTGPRSGVARRAPGSPPLPPRSGTRAGCRRRRGGASPRHHRGSPDEPAFPSGRMPDPRRPHAPGTGLPRPAGRGDGPPRLHRLVGALEPVREPCAYPDRARPPQ